MPQFDEKHVKLCSGFVVWDGVTRPDKVESGPKAGNPKWNLKVVFEPHNPDVQLFEQLARKQLMESKWRGQLPAGGLMPIGQVQPGEFNGMFTGWHVISFKTTMRQPDVYDENGAVLDPMALSSLLYSGQKVDVLAHCYDYDNKMKGIGAGLDAFAIIASAQAPRLAFGGGGVDTASAFGGGQPQQGYGQAPAQGYYPNGSAPAGQATYPGSTGSAGTVGAGANNGQSTGYGAAPSNPAGPAAPAPAPAAEPKFRTPDGGEWTEAQLVGAGWTAEQVRSLPSAGPQAPAQAHNFLPGN